ncbi:AraC family transcriptional regulator [Nannocystis exedens]|uniref:AraC family transcriptional regulator n=1 Tax=Nannocystis exedens TaxID=54 RepID=UPI0014761281|nr:AraC family transcriptional regulator [Nannocystis exedens]
MAFLAKVGVPAVSSRDIPVNVAVSAPLVGAARAGVDVDALLAAVGLDRAAAEDADLALAPAQRNALWREALVRSRDPALALHAAEIIPWGTFDVVDYVVAQAPSLGEGLAALARYFRIIRPDFNLAFEADASGGRLSLDLPPTFAGVQPYTTEFTLGCTIARFRRLTEATWSPEAIDFKYAAPGHRDEYARVFQCPLRFDADATVVHFSRAALDLRQPRADALLRPVLERAAADVLARMPPAPRLTAQLRQVLSEELRGGSPTLEHVARRLAVSPRTLNRRLQAENTSFQQQLAELRCELARGYLENPRISIAEVAYLLGFSEPSAFHRAFKRWTGHSPQAWRARPR